MTAPLGFGSSLQGARSGTPTARNNLCNIDSAGENNGGQSRRPANLTDRGQERWRGIGKEQRDVRMMSAHLHAPALGLRALTVNRD